MLSKNIIDEIDRLACINNTNRSNLINHILAAHLSLSTPEMHIREVFTSHNGRYEKEKQLHDSADLIRFHAQRYRRPKYKPTVRYKYSRALQEYG